MEKQVNGQTAKEVSEMLLALTGEALISNNFEMFATAFYLPHTIETPDYKRILQNRCELRAVFDSVVDSNRRKRVTQMVRYCEVAEFKTETRIEATHITHLMAGDMRVGDPFPNFSVLEWIDDRWQGTSSQYAVDRQTTVGHALSRGLMLSEDNN